MPCSGLTAPDLHVLPNPRPIPRDCVWQALDLESMQEVAVKVHQLNSSWSEAKKVNFVKHALREYRIHR